MQSTFEIIFRQPLRLLLLILLLPLIGVAIAYFLPRNYQTTARIWALRRYEVIGATGTESNLQATPAQTQVTALTDLLQTKGFALSVATSTSVDFASTLNLDSATMADQTRREDAILAEISKNVKVTATGYNLFEISYTNHNADVARDIVQGVIKNYGLQSQALTITEGQQLLNGYQKQLTTAQQAANAASNAEAQYLDAHPNLKNLLLTNSGAATLEDPQYALLHAQTVQATGNVQNIEATIATVELQISAQGQSSDGLFKRIDDPVAATQAVSRTKDFLTSGGIGLGIAIVACVLYVVILVRRDRSIRTALGLQKVVNVPVIMQLPLLSPKTVPLLIEQPSRRSA